jgi:hypothetical protein
VYSAPALDRVALLLESGVMDVNSALRQQLWAELQVYTANP